MNRGDQVDYSTLNWVKAEIDETLKQARLALESFVDNTDDEAQMRFCVTYLHQIYGTLQLVELYGAALVAEEMEKVASGLLDGRIPHKEETFECLMRAILQLPGYLERLQAGQKDIPVALLPLLNDLRATRGEQLLSENAFFAPDLASAPSAVVRGECVTEEAPDLALIAKTQRFPFQTALLGWYRDTQPERNLRQLAEVVQTLRAAATAEPVAQLFWVADALIDALLHRGIEPSVSVKLLLGQVDRQIKRLMDEGEQILAAELPADLIKNLLYYVARADAGGERVQEVKHAFKLNTMLPSEGEIDQARESMSGMNADVMGAVYAAVKEDLTRIKDALDIYLRSGERGTGELRSVADSLKKVADTLGMLGLGIQRNTIQDQITTINAIIAGKAQADDAVLMEVAGALLYIEAGLTDTQGVGRVTGEAAADRAGAECPTALPEADMREVQRNVINEAKANLARVKDAIVAFVSAPWEFKLLTETPALNREIKGSLTMMSLHRVGELVELCNRFIEHDLLEKQRIPDQETLDAFADAVTGLEYYLEAVEENRRDRDSILDLTQESIEKLGYNVEQTGTLEVDVDASGRGVDSPSDALTEDLAGLEPVLAESDLDLEVFDLAPEQVEQRQTDVAEESATVDAVEPEPDLDLSGIAEPGPMQDDEVGATSTQPDAGEDATRAHEPGLHPSDAEPAPATAESPVDAILADAGIELEEIDLGTGVRSGGEAVSPQPSPALTAADEHSEHQSPGQASRPADEAHEIDIDVAPTAEGVFADDGTEVQNIDLETGLVEVDEPGAAHLSPERPVAGADLQILTEPRVSLPSHDAEAELDDDIKEIFLEEAEEELASLRENLPKWKENAGDVEALTSVRRSFHTLKGSGRMVSATDIGEFAWSFENMLNRVIDDTIEPTAEVFGTIDQALEVLPQLVGHFADGTLPTSDAQALADRANALAGRSDAPRLSISVAPQDVEPAPETPPILVEEIGPGAEAVAPASLGDELPVDEAAEATEEAEAHTPVIDPVLLDIFRKEAEGHIATVGNFLKECRDDTQGCFITEDLIRAVHTLHGSAHMAAIGDVADVGSIWERYVKLLSHNKAPLQGHALDLLEDSITAIADFVDSLTTAGSVLSGKDELVARISALYEEAERAMDHQATEALVPEEAILAEQTPASEAAPEESGTADQAGPDAIVLGEDTETAYAVESKAGQQEETEAAQQEFEYDNELLSIFLEEGAEILDASEVTLQNWRSDADNKELVTQLQRELHTLKGGARMSGVTAVGDLSHSLESMIIAVVEGKVAVSNHLFDLMQLSHDQLTHMLEQVRRNAPLQSADDLIAKINTLAERGGIVEDAVEAEEEGAPGEPAAASAREPVGVGVEAPPTEPDATAGEQNVVIPLPVEPSPPVQADKREERRAKPRIQHEQVRVRADLLDDLVNFAGEVSIYRSRVEQQIGAFKYNLAEMDQTVLRLREQLRQFEIETEAQIMYRFEETSDQYDEEFDPLELDRFSHMQQLSRSLMESVGDLASIQGLLEGLTRESETLLLQQSRVSTELQEGLMRTRMVPFGMQIPRLRRIVRQTGSELGKDVEFRIVGEEGELDRTVLERMMPPLEHMLRNAIDHGIETPEVREQQHKPRAGTITLSLAREGSEIVLKLEDDGQGIDRQAIRRKAEERRLIKPDSDLTDKEIMQYILESGFSTAKTVTQISGRGVGMDVVNSEIKQLGGSLHIDSEQGSGTSFTVRLPLTLSINKAILVHVGEDNYAVPLSGVEAIVRVSHEQLESFYSAAQTTYEYGGHSYRFMHLGTLLGVSKGQLPGPGNKVPLLLARAGEHRVALQVESLLGSREIVVKSVGPQISSVRGISGATILGDGSVALILDVSAVVLMDVAMRGEFAYEEPGAQPQETTIMVVDDSITVRRITSRLLERNNYRAITAKDGVDAVALLQEHTPDLFLLDIEMPRMDGYELAQHIRNNERLKHIPIIMITSRTGEKHKQRATDIGVNHYLGKPYQEGELLDSIRSLGKKQD